PFLDERGIEIYGVEAAGLGLNSGKHAASIAGGRPGVLHGNRTYLLMDGDGQIEEAHSISAGLDYPGIGPEHAWLNDMARVTFLSATDDEAVAAFQLCSKLEGIIPALEPAHALARVLDLAPQKPNVLRMKILGAEVRAVESGSKTLKDAMNEALRDWVANVHDTFYCIGTVAGPHPYPAMVRDFQSIIGRETREQILKAENRLPDSLIACIGGGSNAMGLFHPFLDEPGIEIYGVEAAGLGLDSGKHAASIAGGRPGVLHGNRTYLLMNDDGQIEEAHSISAGLDYPGIGPEHAWLNDVKRVKFLSATDDEAVAAFQLCSKLEGIIPALEPAHALARVLDIAPTKAKDHLMVVNVSGRGDKDLDSVASFMSAKARGSN
ncbi:MAG TPA: tryptophan synthase subunit beta, partial [Methyloceanibacter sp.]|nr:tryptophan synthase subunit beta [Methyloceanibacter sp.]